MPRPSMAFVCIALLLSSCARGLDKESVSADEIERYLMSADGEALLLQADLVSQCAQANGFDYVELLPDEQGEVIDPAPGLEGRERILAIGSGRLAITATRMEMREAAQRTPSPEPEVDEILQKILDDGPIVDPKTGDVFQAGCRFWAYETVRSMTGAVERESLAVRYGDWMNERYKESVEYAMIEERQFRCVAEAGYSQIRSIEDMTEIQLQAESDWLDGSLTYEEALVVDRDASLVYFDCRQTVVRDFDELADRVARKFAESNRLVLDD